MKKASIENAKFSRHHRLTLERFAKLGKRDGVCRLTESRGQGPGNYEPGLVIGDADNMDRLRHMG